MTTTEQEALYNRIRGLLRKAERTDNEHEAEAFYSKAQQLIMRYAIDEEKMWANDPEKKAKVETLDIVITDRQSGAQEKRTILHAVAKANRCRMWYSPGMSRATIAGFKSDLVFVEMVFSSIVTQMNFKMAVGVATNPTIHHKTFKNSFFVGFANRIWDRFDEMSRRNMDDLRNQNPGNALVLTDRRAQVDKWVADNIRLGRSRAQSKANLNSQAYGAGQSAANATDISGGRGTIKGQKRLGQ